MLPVCVVAVFPPKIFDGGVVGDCADDPKMLVDGALPKILVEGVALPKTD